MAAADDLAAQHRKLMAASVADSDLDFAFRLQMQEAMAASQAILPRRENGNVRVAPIVPENQLPRRPRRVRDEQFPLQIVEAPVGEWERIEDNIHKWNGFRGDDGLLFHIYVKGLTCLGEPQLSAVGVAICDSQGNLVLKVQKPLFGARQGGREVTEGNALVEGINAALLLGIRRVNAYIDLVSLQKHVIGRWPCKKRKVVDIVDKIRALQAKFETCNLFLLPRCQLQFVIKLARDAIDAQLSEAVELNAKVQSKETCNICLEETVLPDMFEVDNCKHRFCFSCMKQHVEVKLLHGILPRCPHDGCKTMLSVESAKNYLPPKLVDIMTQRIKELSIPAENRVYCPHPKCSALMSRGEAVLVEIGSSSNVPNSDTSGARKCIKCGNLFCIDCKVPWHVQFSCHNFQRYRQFLRPEDAELQELARQRLWRQCIKCNQMIELAEGCYHMTCRCGHEFCYTCGAPWKNKKATCTCPLWDEQYILHNPNIENPNQQFGNRDLRVANLNQHIGNNNQYIANPNLRIGNPNLYIGNPYIGNPNIDIPNQHIGNQNPHMGHPNQHIGNHNQHIGYPNRYIGNLNIVFPDIENPNIGDCSDDYSEYDEQIGEDIINDNDTEHDDDYFEHDQHIGYPNQYIGNPNIVILDIENPNIGDCSDDYSEYDDYDEQICEDIINDNDTEHDDDYFEHMGIPNSYISDPVFGEHDVGYSEHIGNANPDIDDDSFDDDYNEHGDDYDNEQTGNLNSDVGDRNIADPDIGEELSDDEYDEHGEHIGNPYLPIGDENITAPDIEDDLFDDDYNEHIEHIGNPNLCNGDPDIADPDIDNLDSQDADSGDDCYEGDFSEQYDHDDDYYDTDNEYF